jgi:hypothetical protein
LVGLVKEAEGEGDNINGEIKAVIEGDCVDEPEDVMLRLIDGDGSAAAMEDDTLRLIDEDGFTMNIDAVDSPMNRILKSQYGPISPQQQSLTSSSARARFVLSAPDPIHGFGLRRLHGKLLHGDGRRGQGKAMSSRNRQLLFVLKLVTRR